MFVHGALVNARPVAQGRAASWRRTSAASRRTCRSARTSVPMPADADLSPAGVAKLIADFLAALDLENVTLVGNDTGGALCQMRRHASTRSASARLVLTNCDAYDELPADACSSSLFLGRAHAGLRVRRSPSRCGFGRMRQLPIAFGWLSKQRHPGARSPTAGCEPRADGRAACGATSTKLLKGVDPRTRWRRRSSFEEFDKPGADRLGAREGLLPDRVRRAARARLPERAAGADRGLATRSCPRTSRSGSPS